VFGRCVTFQICPLRGLRSFRGAASSHAWRVEPRQLRPVPKLTGVAADPHPGRVRRHRPVQDEELEPAGWAHTNVRRRGDRAAAAGARELREDGAAAHNRTVRAARRGDERDTYRPALREHNVRKRVLPAVRPVGDVDAERRRGEALRKIRRDVHLHGRRSAIRITGRTRRCVPQYASPPGTAR
jgi:hypothetical protein